MLTASSCTIDALAIVGFNQFGIDIQGGTHDVVTRCDISVLSFGLAAGNGAGGVQIGHAASHNTIGGPAGANVISANGGDGVTLFGKGTTGNLIEDNRIGTTLNGTGTLGNGIAGVDIFGMASANIVSGNVLSGNSSDGVALLDAGTTGNFVAGNRIGLGATGSAVPNGFAGVEIALGATGNTVGGTTAASQNVISGNSSYGVFISGTGTTGNTVRNNLVGVGSDPVLDLVEAQAQRMVDEGGERQTRRRYVVWGDVPN